MEDVAIPIKRVCLTITSDLLRCIDHANRDTRLPRNVAIENWLWQNNDVLAAAGEIGVRQPKRRIHHKSADT